MITKEQLQKYINEYNKTHEGKCIANWEESSYYVLLANDTEYHYTVYYIRKFRTLHKAQDYIKNKPWEDYLGGYTTAKIISYDEIVKNYSVSLIPEKYYTCE